ncbi:MAG TPA: hypothetical protein VFT82_02960 [Candidatus Paceibacterota bacterium]|nr:hypothetical protein [Candidatus Paceibacterota bacterium]
MKKWHSKKIVLWDDVAQGLAKFANKKRLKPGELIIVNQEEHEGSSGGEIMDKLGTEVELIYFA